MFTLSIPITSANLAAIKADLGRTLGDVKSSHRCEAIARGFGFRTYASLLAAIRSNHSVGATAGGALFCAYLADHGFLSEPRSFYLAVGRVAITAVLEAEPKLTLHGIGIGRPKQKDNGKWETPHEHYARALESRKDFMKDRSIEQFLLSLAFVGRVHPTKTIRPNTRSYWIKHIVENFACAYPEGGKLGPQYVPNGALIAAAIHAGFRYKKFIDELGYDSLNVTFNMSKSALDDLDCEIRPNGARAQRRRERAEGRWMEASTARRRS